MGEAGNELDHNGVKYVPFYRSFYQVAQNLPDADRLALYGAVNNFCFKGIYPCFKEMDVEKSELLENYFTIMAPVVESTLKKDGWRRQRWSTSKEVLNDW